MTWTVRIVVRWHVCFFRFTEPVRMNKSELCSVHWLNEYLLIKTRRKNISFISSSSSSTMDDRHELQPIVQVFVHFSLSIIELLCVLLILALQIVLNISQACSFHVSVGFWSFPLLFISPLSIWLAIWRRSPLVCFIVILLHFCATLLATVIIIISVFALISPLTCSTSSLTDYYIPLNGIWICLALLFKVCSYLEILLLVRLIMKIDRADIAISTDVIFMWAFSFYWTNGLSEGIHELRMCRRTTGIRMIWPSRKRTNAHQ